MNNRNAQNKLKKQFWLYGVFPLVTVYVIGILMTGYNIINSGEDCFISQSCSKIMNQRASVSMSLIQIIMSFLIMYTLWNSYRVFKLSNSGIERAKKIKVRIYVILFPILAIISSPFLAFGSISFIETSYISIFLNNFVQIFPMQ